MSTTEQPEANGSDATTAPAVETTMRAVVQGSYGSADVLQIARIARPEIAEDEVLVRVHAAGLDRGTWHLMSGRPYLIRILGFGLRRPKNRVPGIDVAGTVVGIGSAVTRLAVGDEVYGIAKGSFAEYAAANQDKLAKKPVRLAWEQAAATPVSASTAYQGVHDVGRLMPGHKLLVIGASGGVGSYAVQIGKAHGAEVTGVCSTPKLELVRSLGADQVLDYTCDDFADGQQHYDLILDIGGNSSLAKLRRALTPTGTVVIVGGEEGGRWTGGFGRSLRAAALSPFVGQRLAMLVAKEHFSTLERLGELIQSGAVTPSVDRTYPLAQAGEAMRQLEAGEVRGKVAITI